MWFCECFKISFKLCFGNLLHIKYRIDINRWSIGLCREPKGVVTTHSRLQTKLTHFQSTQPQWCTRSASESGVLETICEYNACEMQLRERIIYSANRVRDGERVFILWKTRIKCAHLYAPILLMDIRDISFVRDFN